MHLLNAASTSELRHTWPLKWRGVGQNAAFIFDIPANETGFVGFFLAASQGHLAPTLCLDEGQGFSDLTTVSLKVFPITFYHVPIRKLQNIRRVRFQPSPEPASFKFVAFWTKSAVAVAILHYLFNLRYRQIAVLAPGQAGDGGFWSSLKKSSVRIAKFFADVSHGEGARVQTTDESSVVMLKAHMSIAAQSVQMRLEHAFDGDAHPLISFITPTYNTSVVYLNDLVQSFKVQKADYAELILSDDGSTDEATRNRLTEISAEAGITVLFNSQNQGIAVATNAGLKVAQGTWISFIDHDDQFVPGAIAVMADSILQHPEAVFFYTDEIVADATMSPIGSFCKPAYDSVLLSGVNYINHFAIFQRAELEALGWLRTDREGSQDYDLLLRYLSTGKPNSIVHIPFPAYLWRRNESTYSQLNMEKATDHARQSIAAFHNARGHDVSVIQALDPNLHRVVFKTKVESPKVSVIIPNKDSFGLIKRVIDDLLCRTNYPSLEIVVVDNGSQDANVLALYDQLKNANGMIAIEVLEEPFNFAKMINRGAALATGDVFLLLNNDIEVQEPDWLIEMVDCLNFDSAAIIGAKLLYPDGRIQHNGVIVGLGQAAGHWYVGEKADVAGPMGRFNVRQTMTAVTGACMLVTRGCFDAVGGFDAVNFPISYNDIDFCLRARAMGFRTIWTPFAQLTHHESMTRGSDETGDNNIRFKREFACLQERHGTADYVDDAYSPLYDRRYSIPHLAVSRALPKPRPNFFS